MITGELKSKIDSVWNDFWSGGISNPLEVMEQLTYLLFIKGLDERLEHVGPVSDQLQKLVLLRDVVVDVRVALEQRVERPAEHERQGEAPCDRQNPRASTGHGSTRLRIGSR